MTPERWRQIEEVFQAALDLPEGERAPYVSVACGADAELRQQVEALVAQHDESGDFIETPAVEAVSGFRVMTEPHTTNPMTGTFVDPAIGRRLGAYLIVRELGRGGMGAVYLAERADSAFRRRVAIKLIKRGMDTDFILRRFRNERQILATLDHPHIAKLLDGGTTEEGLPYFVMEFIEGQPVYQYCDERRLNVTERLRLFAQVCDAVDYAHRSLVIHRDIKPSNIMVTPGGAPKLLDFGIAKVLNPELAADITLDPTGTAMLLMTPEYAAPEQVRGHHVTPSTDVYSLGVLLYELLTGHRPYRLVHRSPHEIARVICEEEPAPPSEVVSRADGLVSNARSGEDAVALAQLIANRRATVDSLARQLVGDLDRVVMKALSKSVNRRYQTAAQLRDDIQRHLEGRPIAAPTIVARGADTESGAAFSETILAVLPLKLLDADIEDEYIGVGLADALVARLSSVQRFVVRPTSSVLRYAEIDPLEAGRQLGVDYVVTGTIRRAGPSIRVSAQLLDVREGATRWARKFDGKSGDVLHLEDTLSEQLASALVPHLTGDEQRELQKRGTESPEAYEAYLRGRFYWNTFTEEGFAKALVSYSRAIAIDPNYAAPYGGIADYYNWLGVYGIMPFAECSAAAREAARKAVELDPTSAEAYTALGFATITHDFDWQSAERQHLRALELNPKYATAHQWYGFHLAMEGRFEESVAEMQRARALDPLTPSIVQALSWAYYQARQFDEAVAASRQLLDIEPNFAYGLATFSWILRRAGQYEEAVKTAQKAVEIAGGGQFFLAGYAAALAAAGHEQEARAALAQLREVAKTRYVSSYHLAIVHLHLGERDRALQFLEEAYAEGDGWLVWIGVEPQLDPLRDEPRFENLLRRTNNPELARRAPETAGTTGTHSLASLRTSEDEEARQLYQAARYFATKRTAEGLRQAIVRLESAVKRDPRFALAYAELADCYALLNWYVEPPPANAWPKAREAAYAAVAADDHLAVAHASLGFVKCHFERDWPGAESELRRAVNLDPGNTVARRWHAFNLSAMGRHEEALAEVRRAQEITPLSPVAATGVANVLFLARRFDEAVEACRRALEIDPGAVAAHVVLRWAYEKKGMREEALAVFEQERAFAGDTPTTRAKRAHVLACCGRADEAREILKELLARREDEWVTAYEIAVINSLLGERDEAFRWLARAEEEHAVGFTFVAVDPHLDALRDDTRFKEMLRRLKSPAA